MTKSPLIVCDPEILGGTACIATTRLPVHVVAARYKSGESPASILDGYPDLTAEHVLAAVAYAAEHPLVEVPGARPWRERASRQAAE